MRKIKINGKEIEADDDTLRWLVFDIGSQVIENVEAQTQTKTEAPHKKVCIVCNKDITHTGRWKFCSQECYEKHYTENGMGKLLVLHTKTNKNKKTCVLCGKKLKGIQKKYCKSKECRLRAQRIWQAEWNKRHHLVPTKIIKRDTCKVCGVKLPKGKRTICPNKDCQKKANRDSVKAWFARQLLHKQKETTQKIQDLESEGGVKEQNDKEEIYKAMRRKYIHDTADKLCRFQGVNYEKALSMASLQWEALQMKHNKELTPEYRLLQSLARGEIGVITGVQLSMVNPNKKFSEFCVWVAMNQAEIKQKLQVSGNFIVSNGYIRYQK